MADDIKPQNVIFKIRTQVTDKDDPAQLADTIETVDKGYQAAQATIDKTDKVVAKHTATLREQAKAQQNVVAGEKAIGAEAAAAAPKVEGLSATVAKAGGNFKALSGIDEATKGVLDPLINDTNTLGTTARSTEKDLERLADKAAGVADAAGTIPPVGEALAPGGLPKSPTDTNLPAHTEEVKTFASAMVALAKDGTIAFDTLKSAARSELETLKALNAEAVKTPQGQQAIAEPLSKAQAEALDLLVTTKAITAEERKILEVSTQIANAAGKQDPAVKKVGASWQSLRAQMQQAKAELDAMVEASDGKITPELIAAGKRAGELQDRFEDLQGTVAAFNPDKKFQVFANVIQNVAGGFTALQGVIGLVGGETEGVQKSILKVQSALAVTQGLQALFGGLRDNLKNLRLLFLQNASAARILAAAEVQAGAGAATQGALTAGLSRALRVARVAAIELFTILAANPAILIAAGLGIITVAIYAMATANEVALVSADKLLGTLESLSKVRDAERDNRKTEAGLENERQLLEEVLALEIERTKIPSNASEEQKALANLLIDEKIAAANRNAERKKALLDVGTLNDAIRSNQSERAIIEKDIEAAYRKAGQEYIQTEGLKGQASLDASKTRIELTEEELQAAVARAKVNEELSEDELADLAKLEQRREELVAEDLKNQRDINAVRLQSRNAEIQNQVDITKATERESAAREKLANSGVRANTIEALQQEQARLQKMLNEQLVIASPQFFATAEKYIEVTKAITRAQDLIKGVEVFPIGSLQDLQQELTFLKDLITRIPEASPDFDRIKGAIEEAQKAVDELNKRLQPKDPKEETARLLAELAERQRHFNAVADIDDQAAVTRARNAGATDEEVKAIEDKGHRERLQAEIDFELERLRILEASGSATAAEVTAQQNKLKELRFQLALPDEDETKKTLAELVEVVTDAAAEIADAGFKAWGAWSKAQEDTFNAQLSNQQRRVDEARALAEKGNGAILEAEKKKLGELTEARRKAAQRNNAIAQSEAAAQAVVAIARAAAEGGGFLSAVTIAATLVALSAGIIQARQTASDAVPSFRRGGAAKWSALGGYTGAGDPNQPSTALGRKPYQYEREEFVMPHEVVRVGRNRQWFDTILRGRKNLDDMMGPQSAVMLAKGGGMSDKQVDRLVRAVQDQPEHQFNMDRDGLTVMVRGRMRQAHKMTQRRK